MAAKRTRKARPKSERKPKTSAKPSADTEVVAESKEIELQTVTCQFTLPQLAAVKQALSRAEGLTAQGKILTGEAEAVVDAVLPPQ